MDGPVKVSSRTRHDSDGTRSVVHFKAFESLIVHCLRIFRFVKSHGFFFVRRSLRVGHTGSTLEGLKAQLTICDNVFIVLLELVPSRLAVPPANAVGIADGRFVILKGIVNDLNEFGRTAIKRVFRFFLVGLDPKVGKCNAGSQTNQCDENRVHFGALVGRRQAHGGKILRVVRRLFPGRGTRRTHVPGMLVPAALLHAFSTDVHLEVAG